MVTEGPALKEYPVMNQRPTLPLIPDAIDIRLRHRYGGSRGVESIDVGHILPLRSIL